MLVPSFVSSLISGGAESRDLLAPRSPEAGVFCPGPGAVRPRHRLVPLDSLGGSESPAVEADALNALVSAAERARVRAALSELRPDDRELLRLCYFEGLTPTELAARLGEPAERIRKRKSRALERLRAAFLGRHTSHESAMVST